MMRQGEAIRVRTQGGEGVAGAPFHADGIFARAALQAGIGAWTCDLADNAITWTAGVYDLFGLSAAEHIDRRETVALYDEESRDVMERLRHLAVMQARPFTMEAQIVRPNGVRRWMRLSADVVRENGRTTQLFGMKQDITDEKARWDALRRLAENDPLTGLKNRAVYQNDFLDAPMVQPRFTPLGALALFDLDGFKQINDRHGHAAGDACLKVLAQRLKAAFCDALLVARIGGDEFAVLVDASLTPAMLQRRVARVLAELGEPVIWNGRILGVGASAGLALVDHPYRYDAEAMFAAADEALYAAKAGGRGGMRISGDGAGGASRACG